MNQIFNEYLEFIFEEKETQNLFINFKKYESKESPELRALLEKAVPQENLFSYPQKIAVDRFFQGMEHLHLIYAEFLSKQESSLAYAQACFLVLEMMDEMLYDEYRSLQSVLEKVVNDLLEKETVEIGIILAAGLLKAYLNPRYLDVLEKMDYQDELFQYLKMKVKENLIQC